MILEDGRGPTQTADTSNALITAIVQARYWWTQLCDTPNLSVAALARQEGCNPTHVNRILKLAFLDPKIVQAILERTTPLGLTLERLTRGPAFPPRWQDQREMLGITTRP